MVEVALLGRGEGVRLQQVFPCLISYHTTESWATLATS